MVLNRRRESLGEYNTPLDTDPSYDGVTERFGKMPETYELVRTDDHSSIHVPDYQVRVLLGQKELPEGNKFLHRKDYDNNGERTQPSSHKPRRYGSPTQLRER